MAYVNIFGAETGDTAEAKEVGGTYSISSTAAHVRTGTYGVHFDFATGTGYLTLGKHDSDGSHVSMALTDVYVTFYVKVVTDHGATINLMRCAANSDGTSAVCDILMDSAGKVYANGTAPGSTTTETIDDGDWHRIDVQFQTNNTCSVSVDGGTAVTSTGNNQNCNWIQLCDPQVGVGNTDIAIDDVAIADDDYPGKGQLVRMAVDGDGTFTDFTGDYTDVDEVPHDGDTSYASSSTLNDQESAALESASSAGVSGTIGTVKAYGIIRRETSSGNTKLQLTVDGSVEDELGLIDPGTTYVFNGGLWDTNPQDAGAWENADLDGTEVGYQNKAAVAQRITALGLMVWSSGSVTETITPTGTLTTAGALDASVLITLAGTLTTAGALAWSASVSLAGTLATSGAVTMLRVVPLAVAGVLSTAGSLQNQANKALSGTLTTAGSIAWSVSHSVSGILSTAGALTAGLQVFRTFEGTLSFSSHLRQVFPAITRLKLAGGSAVGATLGAVSSTWTRLRGGSSDQTRLPGGSP